MKKHLCMYRFGNQNKTEMQADDKKVILLKEWLE